MIISFVLILSNRMSLEERQESNMDGPLEEWEMQWQSPQSPELHSCFIRAGNKEIKGALHR